MITIDTSQLLSYYQTRTGQTGGAATGGGLPTAGKRYAPTPPWDPSAKVPRSSALVQSVMAGRSFINEGAAQLDLPGASSDYRKLFALYQGLNALSGLAGAAGAKGISALDLRRTQEVFARGLAETNAYLQGLDLEKIRLTAGSVDSAIRSGSDLATQDPAYVTQPLFTGKSTDAVPAFAGDVAFTVTVKRVNSTFTVPVDLAGMGAETRSMTNVVKYINDQLKAQGVFTRFAAQETPGAQRTIKVGGKDVPTGVAGPSQWALKINTDSFETVTLSAAATQPAVYLAQSVGDPDPDKDPATKDGKVSQQLVKFQTAGTPPERRPGETNYVDGRVFARSLGDSVGAVHATATAPDGSVYVLADVTGTTDGQAIKGTQDVALLKYDSAGALVYSRTLGARGTASGLALSVAADGKVAVAGSVTGALQTGETIADPALTDSFVSLYDAKGDEMWTQRRAARADDQATAIAFGGDGSVYVAGQAKSAVTGASAVGGQDNYLMGFSPTGTAKFSTQFGTAATDRVGGLLVDGTSLVVAGTEDGHGVLRRFDLAPGGGVTAAGTRDLGDLQGGVITGLALDGGELVVAGSTRNGALSVNTVTRAYTGGYDAFAARIAADLSPVAGDALAYFGGSGDDRAAGLAVAGGKVWLTGSAGTDLPGGLDPVGKADGFVVSLDVGAGTVDWARRFSGDDRMATPTAISVDTSGASALDRLGLPSGVVDPVQSTLLTSATALRAGDQFSFRNGEGQPVRTVTIEAKDTFDDLLSKVRRALNFNADVSLISDPLHPGVKHLQIKPQGARSTPEILAGPAGRDGLVALGLTPGVARTTAVINGKLLPADGKGQIYGLKLPSQMSLDSPEAIKAASAAISSALTVVHAAYTDLRAAAMPQPRTAPGKTVSGPVPQYLKSQIANYQAALSRLTGQ